MPFCSVSYDARVSLTNFIPNRVRAVLMLEGLLKLLQNSVATGREREWAKAHLSAVGSISKTWPNNTCSAGGFRFVH
jgi:hypothetical protein